MCVHYLAVPKLQPFVNGRLAQMRSYVTVDGMGITTQAVVGVSRSTRSLTPGFTGLGVCFQNGRLCMSYLLDDMCSDDVRPENHCQN